MDRKRSFYGRVSPAILQPIQHVDPRDQTPREASRARNTDVKPPTPNTTMVQRPRFQYRFNPRLLDIDEFTAGAVRCQDQETEDPSRAAESSDGEKHRFKECVICAEERSVDVFLRVTARCSHSAGTCRDCITTGIRSDLDNKRWTEIKCPQCEEGLEYVDVHRLADHQAFERFESFVLRATMEGENNFRWCRCGFGQVHASGKDQPIMTCLHCGAKRCFRHDEAWHENMSCEEYDRLLQDPDNFRSKLELGTITKQESEDSELARGLWARDEEALRRRKEHEEEERLRAKKLPMTRERWPLKERRRSKRARLP